MLVAIVHSLLGELLIFGQLRTRGVVPTEAAAPLRSGNIRILWATWHLASVFGLGFAAILFAIATGRIAPDPYILHAVIWAFIGGSALVLLATKGKHPGWVGLMAVATLVYLGSVS
ncbi:MAG: hypothetical protein V4673_11975 [Pseudomonadota bacterium]